MHILLSFIIFWGGREEGLFLARSLPPEFSNYVLCRAAWDLLKKKYDCMYAGTWNYCTAGYTLLARKLMTNCEKIKLNEWGDVLDKAKQLLEDNFVESLCWYEVHWNTERTAIIFTSYIISLEETMLQWVYTSISSSLLLFMIVF